MRLADYAERLIGLARAVYAWAGAAAAADIGRREKVALYSEEIAATLARAAGALTLLERNPEDRAALLAAVARAWTHLRLRGDDDDRAGTAS